MLAYVMFSPLLFSFLETNNEIPESITRGDKEKRVHA